MKTCVHLCQYITEFFLEWEMYQREFVEKIETRILYTAPFFPKIVPFMR
jgi:hypothetical protein